MYILPGAYEPPEGRKERPTPHYSMERHLNLNGRDTSLIWTYSQVGRKYNKCCFHSQRAKPAFALYRAHTALAMTVNELHVFLSSQPWNKKENARSKGSESGRRCTRACTSYVASGVEKAKLRGHLQSTGHCILSPLRLE